VVRATTAAYAKPHPPQAYTYVYAGVVPLPYRFTAETLDRLARNRVSWQSVLFVLDVAHPQLREWIGATLLRVIAADQAGDLLMVTMLEQDDAVFDILTARYLDADESAAASTALQEG
jgi:hypothetical protein